MQVVTGDLIVFFNQIFDALCKLSADSDGNVQSAAHLLDRLVKVKCHQTFLGFFFGSFSIYMVLSNLLYIFTRKL